jgi:hypothetical protein
VRFSAPVQKGPGDQPVSYTLCTGSFSRINLLGRGFDHTTPYNAEVKERVELNLYSPLGLSWPVVGCTSPKSTACSSSLGRQNIPCIYGTREVHYHVPKISPLFSILSQLNSVRDLPSDYFQIFLALLYNLCLGLPSCLLPLGYHINNLQEIPPFVPHAPPTSSSLILSLQ